jgi:2'-5' RNA ligase
VRLFAAVELPEPARRSVLAHVAGVRAELPPAAWVRSEALHLTLVFFGEVAAERSGELATALAAAAGSCPAFPARLSGAGGFPPRGPVRVVWLGVEPADRFGALAAAVRGAAAASGFAFDAKPFAAHVTLARCRSPWPAPWRERLARLALPGDIEWAVRRAALIESELAPGGSRYRTVAELPLAGEAA